MKVFFGTTTAKLIEYYDVYSKVRQGLINQKCIILDDWLESAYDYKLKNPKGFRDRKRNFNLITKAIDRCDFVVIEFTVPNFSSSHQITYAITRQKPVLVLRLEKDNSFADSYLEWIDSKLITIKDYEIGEVDQVLKEFIGFNTIGRGLKRYNVVLDDKHKYYLDWASEKKKESRSEIIRNALDEHIDYDREFQRYIRTK